MTDPGQRTHRRRRRRATASQGPPPETPSTPAAEPLPTAPAPTAEPTAPATAAPTPPPPTAKATAAPRKRREPPPDRGLRELVGAGRSLLGVSGALRGRDVNRPTEEELAAAEQEVVIVRRNWKPRDDA